MAKFDFYYSVRETYMYIRKLLSIPGLPDLQIQQLQDSGFLTQLTLDTTVIPVLKNIDQEQLGSLEIGTREFIFKYIAREMPPLRALDSSEEEIVTV